VKLIAKHPARAETPFDSIRHHVVIHRAGVVAIAMHEQNGRNLRCPRGSRRSLRKGCESEVAGCQRQGAPRLSIVSAAICSFNDPPGIFGILAALYDC